MTKIEDDWKILEFDSLVFEKCNDAEFRKMIQWYLQKWNTLLKEPSKEDTDEK